jgi:DnaJ family protein C protein 8
MSSAASSSSSKPPSNTPSSAPTPAISDAELDRLLSREASAFQREIEVERILKAFKLKWVQFSFYSLSSS